MKTYVLTEVIKNLLSAQKRIAESGNARDLLKVSRYLLKLTDQRCNVLVNILPDEDESGSSEPVE